MQIKTNKFVRSILIFMGIWLGAVLFNPVFAASIGVSPGGIYNESLKPGSTFVQEFIISRGNPDKTVAAEIQIDAEDFRDWITITPGTDMILPAGTQRVPFTVTLTIPEDSEYGKYEGYIRVILKNEDQGQVSIQPAVRLDLDFILTEKDVRLFDAQNAIIQDTNESSPMIVELKIRNNGNVTGAPDFVQVEVYSLDEKLVDTFSSNEIPDISPFTTDSVEVLFEKHGLKPGTYVGEIVVKDLNVELLKDRSIFNVYEGSAVEDLNNLPETGEGGLINRIKELLKNSLSENLAHLSAMIGKYKYYLIGGFLFTSFLIIFILLLVDRDKDEDKNDEGKET